MVPAPQSAAAQLWRVNPKCRRRKSSNGINLVFVPGQNVVLELNVVAGEILEVFDEAPGSYGRVYARLRDCYEIENESQFELEVQQLLERLITHEILLVAEGTTP